MRNLSGPPVSGEDFLFRERELAYAARHLAGGNSLLVFGLRKIGKSSFLLELRRRMQRAEPALTCCYLDVQDLRSGAELFLELLNALPKDAGGVLQRRFAQAKTLPSRLWNAILARVHKGGVGGASLELNRDVVDYWEPLAEAFADTISALESKVVLLIDELPFFLQNLVDDGHPTRLVRQILATLRKWRNQNISMVLAGSISIDSLLEELGLSGLLLNDPSRLSLGPLEPEQAAELLRRLAESAGLRSWSEETIGAVLARLDDHFPFFLQCAFSHLSAEDRADPEYLERVFLQEIEPDLHRAFFSQFDERLIKHFAAEERRSAEAALNILAAHPDGELEVARLRTAVREGGADLDPVLHRLQAQEFLVRGLRADTVRFPYRLLRRWRRARGAS